MPGVLTKGGVCVRQAGVWSKVLEDTGRTDPRLRQTERGSADILLWGFWF